ncbi:PKD domain-containing protein [Chamaesiphon polymorphus]|nr:PKD domain-containing protein [Chamaesiphon polymorphus]
MASGLEIGERRLPSELDITLAAAPSIDARAYSAPLLGVGINNGDFSIDSNQAANYGWQTNGATTISNGIATLADTSKQLASLTQKFLIPANATKLQFTIKNSQLRSALPNTAPTPNDSFEVALLDAQMNPLAGKAQGLSNTDSLLNIQADGTVYFSDKVQIGGATISGGKIANTTDRTVTIDLTGIANNTEAQLYFDLLSFGSGASQVSIDNVKIFNTTQPAPRLDNATLATNQATGLTIPLPTGVSLESIELSTLPQHGTVVRNPSNGKITYTPNSDYVGADSFTYLGIDSNGQVSNPATINITVNNVAPTIESIVIPTTVKEGQTIPLSATAKDGGSSNNLTYSWNFGDGSNPIIGRDVSYTYKDNGNYNVTLSVTDKDGGTTTQTSLVKVDNVAPTVNITAPVTDTNQGGTLNFGVTYTDPGILDTHTITWNFGDGSAPLTGVTNPSHLFSQAGTKNVTVTVTDNDGASTSQSMAITVTSVAPTINSIDIPTNINEGQLVQLTATATGTGALTYNWYVDNATTPIVGQTLNYAFADNGVYPVKLTVIDSNSVITTQTVSVTVNNVAPIIVNIIKPSQINEGEPVSFKAIATDPGINDNLSYVWNFGDSTPLVNGQNVTHTFADNGSYNVILRVTDSDGAFATQTVNVKVDNVAPVIASIVKPATIKEGESAEFKATATDTGANDTLTYNWNFGDSTPGSSGQNVNHTFVDNGNYNVVLTVTDKDGGVTTQTVVAKVDNVAPSIVSIAKPTTIKEGESVTFSATATDPGILDTLTYSWNFGDSTPGASGQNVNHIFVDNGNYNVTLTVTDKDGAATTQTVVAKVDNVAPTIVSIAKPTTIKEGESVAFAATVTDPGVLDTLTYSWNFGDSTPVSSGQNVNHTFADNGNYNITLTVTDKDGASTTQTVVAKVDNVAPKIVSIAKPTTIKEGESVAFAATVTDPGINDTLTYSWNFGDSTPTSLGQNVNHTFADNGNYNVVLTVTDKDGGVTTQTVVAKVDNVAPVIVSIVKPNTIKEGESVTFTATATDVGSKDTLTYSWNFGDGTSPVTGQNVTRTFADNGNYNVVLTVTDKDGAVTTQTVVVKVDNVAPTITSVTLPQNVLAGTAAAFTATATDVGTLDTLTYSWNFGDNSTPVSGQTVNRTYTAAGTYTIILTVTDKDGAITTQTQNLTVTAPPTTGGSGIRAGGNITINGSADFDGSTTNRTDDTQIYAAKGISLNGNISLPVKRDSSGNPLKVNGKIVLVDNQITLGTGATTTTNPNQYTNFTTADRAITIPTYAALQLQEFTPPASATVNTFNVQTTPIRNSADWTTKFPAAGTASNPTVVRIINGDLNLPANINLSNYILIVENGNINFSQGNPVLNNVKLIANAGKIDLNSNTATNLSLSASGNINITGNTKLGGTSIISSNGNITTNGGLSMASSTATVRMVAQGDFSVSGNTSLKGQLFAKKNITINGQTTIVGSIDALLNLSIGGNTTIVAK